MTTYLASLALSVSFVSLAALAGCSFDLPTPPPNGTLGTQGQVRFSYALSTDCLDTECSSMKAMMLGTSEFIAVDADALPDDLVVTAEDPAVLGVSFTRTRSCCITTDTNEGGCTEIADGEACKGKVFSNYEITADALSAGQTKLDLKHSADGSLFDAVPLEVKLPATLSAACQPIEGASVEIVSSLNLSTSSEKGCALHCVTADAQGVSLQATSGFTITTENATIARVDPPFTSNFPGDTSHASDATVSAVSPGTTKLLVSAGALSKTFDLAVTK